MTPEERRRTNRRARRALSDQGVAAMSRVVIERSAIVSAMEKGVDAIDLTMLHIDRALHELIDQGGDIFGKCVVLVGANPDYPDAVTIEAKVATLVKPAETENGA